MRGRLHRRARALSGAAAVAVMVTIVAPAPAHADFWCWLFKSGCDGGPTTQQSSDRAAAPEIDPQALAGTLAMLAGGAAILADRVRRRR